MKVNICVFPTDYTSVINLLWGLNNFYSKLSRFLPHKSFLILESA